MKKISKLLKTLPVLVLLTVLLSGCTDLLNWGKDFKQDFKGLDMVIQTYDNDSQLIDSIKGKSVKIEKDTTFDRKDSEGETRKESKVLSITVGGENMTHVGSSLIAYEDGMTNVFEEYAKTVKIDNQNKSVPMLNSMVNEFQNDFTGKSKTILIRSQNGSPLATFTGDSIRMSDTDVPSSTNFLIDGKRLFVYRCDYTVYDNKLLLEN
ncbi:DUF5052 family protein [Vagococcus fluvialis]|uniref:DUF5052 domain-containing protein n=1 Tax=Vagococcus fluvialis TaxID=2738 RepID=A0A369ATJ6_9ENTE|nr:DUF5052 family protein [Vagococcus fluvialis]MBO0478701.1 DUF5052 family protein [Vagococcus fluvialis]MBO0484454.1 DUF5052 family protein [Vagococcus fluvialis]MBO0488243.1 DUF5052 family protein [Vagococcus fluvialis]MDT2746169.1 DUF5052 family protein [Vagococcus fluvialis]NKC58347.1 DUF5052 family protein [Vagococcus fluvialis]